MLDRDLVEFPMENGGVSYGYVYLSISDYIRTISGPYLLKYAYLSISVAYLLSLEPLVICRTDVMAVG